MAYPWVMWPMGESRDPGGGRGATWQEREKHHQWSKRIIRRQLKQLQNNLARAAQTKWTVGSVQHLKRAHCAAVAAPSAAQLFHGRKDAQQPPTRQAFAMGNSIIQWAGFHRIDSYGLFLLAQMRKRAGNLSAGSPFQTCLSNAATQRTALSRVTASVEQTQIPKTRTLSPL